MDAPKLEGGVLLATYAPEIPLTCRQVAVGKSHLIDT